MQPSPCWIGRRQCHFDCRVSTIIDFAPARDGEEAGLTVFQNYKHHYEIAITRIGGRPAVIVRRKIGSLQKIEVTETIDNGPLELTVLAEPMTYKFAWSRPGGVAKVIGEGEARYLSTEVGGRFTGVYFAMYATGNGKQSTAPAYFDWFEYVPKE